MPAEESGSLPASGGAAPGGAAPGGGTGDRLDVVGLSIRSGARELVSELSFSVHAGRVVVLLGASGSGKSMTARACLGLVRARPGVVAGSITLRTRGETLGPLPLQGDLRALRGRLIGLLPQDAAASLDPLWTVGRQLKMVLRLREDADPIGTVEGWLQAAGFWEPARVAGLYPHALSGGMAQRVAIALALARGARFLLADEPTTGLDPTVQAVVADRVVALSRAGLGLLFITHDLRLARRIADDILLLDEGRIVERLCPAHLGAAQSAAGQRLIAAATRLGTIL